MTTFFCVLKSGGWKASKMVGEYTTKQVLWLKKQVKQHYRGDFRFVCLSDMPVHGVEVVPLKHNWPGWWSKIELFRPDLDYECAFYLDLDTVIVRDIGQIVDYPHEFSVLKNLSMAAKNPETSKIGSGVMAWRKGIGTSIYKQFLADPDGYMRRYTTSEKWGDQGFIEDHILVRQRFQDMFPGAIVSSKFGLVNERPGKLAKIVCFHGSPKPWETNYDWVPSLEK